MVSSPSRWRWSSVTTGHGRVGFPRSDTSNCGRELSIMVMSSRLIVVLVILSIDPATVLSMPTWDYHSMSNARLLLHVDDAYLESSLPASLGYVRSFLGFSYNDPPNSSDAWLVQHRAKLTTRLICNVYFLEVVLVQS